MFQTLNLVCDSSTLANFVSWSSAISAWFKTAGWLQSGDTGQVNWSTIAAVPASNTFVYEVWEPNDGLTNFYLKVEYGNSGAANSPGLRLSIGTATNGAGVLTGTVMGPFTTVTNGSIVSPGASNLYPCYFSGAPGRVSILMWRGAPNYAPQVFSVERGVNAAGAYAGAHVTLMTAGPTAGYTAYCAYNQQTLVFSIGVAPAQSTSNPTTQGAGGLAVRSFFPNSAAGSNFGGSVPFDTTAPMVGFFDYPLTSLGWGNSTNYTDGQIFTTTLYGTSRTYVATNSGVLFACGPAVSHGFLCVRYD